MDNTWQLASKSVTTHAWNKDRTQLAFCPNNSSEIHIHKRNASTGVLEPHAILSEHDKTVTSLDWAPKSNRILSCSQDRNAYVWKQSDLDGQWIPTLVILRINRAATCVKFAPNEKKFAVASGSKCVDVCYYDSDYDWWASKTIRRHKSTVLSVAWHPNSLLLATSSTDFRARVFAAVIPSVDKIRGSAEHASSLPSFGTLMGEYPANGWVNSVAWSPSGSCLAFVAQDSSVTLADVAGGFSPPEVQLQRLKSKDLPFRQCIFASECVLVAAGHDYCPVMFQKDASSGIWRYLKKAESEGHSETKRRARHDSSAVSTASKGRKEPARSRGHKKAARFWIGMDKYGSTSGNETTVPTTHQNAITALCPVKEGPGGRLLQFSSTGLDGKMVLWDMKALDVAV